MIAGLVAAVAVGLLTAALTGPVLRWLPEPAGLDSSTPAPTSSAPAEAGYKTPYGDLASGAFIAVCGLLSAGATAMAWLALAPSVQPMWWVLSSAGLVLAAIDARTTWLPLRLTRVAWLMMGAAALGSAAWGGGWSLLVRAATGAAVAGLLYLVIWLGSRGGFGFGDVRFAPLLGSASAAQSWTQLIWTLLLGTMVGGVHGLIRLVRRRREGFPYAPSMLAGAYLACVALALTG